jgi:beta-glucosidase
MNPANLSSRRRFLAQAGALAAAGSLPLSGTAQTSAVATPAPTTPASFFPPDFLWGMSTSSYQIEGAAAVDGRKPSIWDTFSHTAGRTANGDHGDVACDHYHRFPEDVALLAELGVTDYRFSISWSRVIPDGTGAINEKGFDFYRRLLDALRDRGITPHVALYHWDLPQALQDRYGGWADRRIAADFADYTAAVVRRLGDRVKSWITMNEILSFTGIGYGVGKPGGHAPGLAVPTDRDRQQIVLNALVAHGLGCQAIRAASPGPCRIGIAENYTATVPLVETPEHIEAARRSFLADRTNGGLLVPLLTGRFDDTWRQLYPERVPVHTDADLRTLAQPLDWLGYNCYTGQWVRAADKPGGFEQIPSHPGYPAMNVSWLRLLPEAAYWGARHITDALKRPDLPVFITENGCPDSAPADSAGLVLDTDRILYLRAYLRQLQRAVADGYPLRGYFGWSLLDNFEWADGYAKRFGLVHTDFSTQKRTPKASFAFLREVIRQRRVV